MNNLEPKPATAAREAEPTATLTTLPMWLFVLLFLLLFWGAVSFDKHGGWFNAKVYGPYVSVPDLDRFQPRDRGGPNLTRGRALFEQACAVCHGSDGAGKPNQAPPLAGSDWVVAPGPNRVIHVVMLGLSGPITVSGKQYNFPLPMTPFGNVFPDEDLAAIISYVRQAWGNQASPVTAEQVGKVRAEIGNRTQTLTVEEALRMPEALP